MGEERVEGRRGEGGTAGKQRAEAGGRGRTGEGGGEKR